MRANCETISAVPGLTDHAVTRMQQRRVSETDIDVAIGYGRVFHTPAAEIFVVGQSEIRKYDRVPEMSPALNGLHVICDRHTGAVITVYRDKSFRRAAFASQGRRHIRAHS
jgi:hypothetical protein